MNGPRRDRHAVVGGSGRSRRPIESADRAKPVPGRAVRSFVARSVGLALLLLGCAPASIEPSPNTPESLPTTHDALDGTEWILETIHGRPPVAEARVKIDFTGTRFSGYDGCNWGGGDYQVGPDGAVAIGATMQTARGCSGPAAEQQNREYGTALANARALRWTEDRLELLDAGGATALVFARLDLGPSDPADLVGTAWRLVEYDEAPVAMPNELRFTSESEFTVSAGCHTLAGTYLATEDDISFPSLGVTPPGCSDVPWTQAEGRLLEAVSGAGDYELAEDRLTLLSAEVHWLVFEPLEGG